MATVFTDKGPALSGTKTSTFRADEVKQSLEFRKQYESRTNVVLAEDMPWEHSADGLIKHLVHEKLNTREMCVEAYMQFLKPGEKSGIHRHMWEELIFVVEGSGYDLHWDLKWDCLEAFQWEWAAEPKAYSWKRGDYIYIPPFTNHQHVAGDHEECRLIVMSNRITKEMGFDWFDQVEAAAGYDAKMKNGGGRVACVCIVATALRFVMAGLDPAIHDLRRATKTARWMPGTRPGMTWRRSHATPCITSFAYCAALFPAEPPEHRR